MAEIGQRWLKLFIFQKAQTRLFFLQKSFFFAKYIQPFLFLCFLKKWKAMGGRISGCIRQQKRIYVICLCKCNLSATFQCQIFAQDIFSVELNFAKFWTLIFLREFTYTNYVKDNFLQQHDFANPGQFHVTSFPREFLPLNQLKR